MTNTEIIKSSRAWVEKMVIGLGLCPFAAKPYNLELVDFIIIEEAGYKEMLDKILDYFYQMCAVSPDVLSNRLLILPYQLGGFLDYLDFFFECEQLLAKNGLSDDLQLTSFHPKYIFDGAGADDIANSTNRSPYPMVHILRVSEVTEAIEAYGDTSKIYQRNIDVLNKLGAQGIEDVKNT